MEPSLVEARYLFRALAFSALISVCGCNDAPINTWSAESKSPNGAWVAIAQSQRGGAFGGSYDETTVQLRQLRTSQKAITILVFSHENPTMNIKITWVNPTHLDVQYGDNAKPGDYVTIAFQAIKCGNVDITLERLPVQPH